MKKVILFVWALCMFEVCVAQENTPSSHQSDNDSIMVTVIMRHQQEKPVDTIQQQAMRQHFYQKLSACHAKIESWHVVMGIGQIITLKFTPQYLREVNIVFESGAWGGFNTEFYPTYDFMSIYPKMLEKEKKLNKGN